MLLFASVRSKVPARHDQEEKMKEFFGIPEYTRTPEGAFSWQHIAFVGSLLAIMIILGIVLGLKYRRKPMKSKNRVIIIAAILIDAVEIIKLVSFGINAGGFSFLRTNLPLFLCSIQLIALPVAAFSRGRLKEASLDFVFIFGLLGAIAGTVGAIQNYNAYPVLGIHNVASGITHSIAGFSSLFIGISGMASMKKKNIPIVYAILLFFCAAAYIANKIFDYNYMFLVRDDGTPYSILTGLTCGNLVLYTAGVVVLFLVYVALFYLIYYFFTRKKRKD